jgi:hypothetical protein
MRTLPDPRLSRAQARAVGQGRFYDPGIRRTAYLPGHPRTRGNPLSLRRLVNGLTSTWEENGS